MGELDQGSKYCFEATLFYIRSVLSLITLKQAEDKQEKIFLL